MIINITAVNIKNKIEVDLYNSFLQYVSNEKQEKIKRFRKHEDAQRALIGEMLVRKIISENLDIGNEDIVFGQNEYGKPCLKNVLDFHFNISHAGDWVVCATHCFPVGVDIEQIRLIDFIIAKRFFVEEEYIDLMNKGGSQRVSYFYELWTLKESYIKAAGKGLSIPLDSFGFRIVDGRIFFKSKDDSQKYYFKQYDIDSDYKMAVCGLEDKFSCGVKKIDVIELIL